ncbi:MAG TPA: fused MFS/spermidine synthase [Longimicrobiales bacterium]|nr:fused MFS/spermidine synthase [Longimicrobiales bacterium]
MTRLRSAVFAALALAVVLALLADRSRVVHQEGAGQDRIRVLERPDGVRELLMGTSRGRQTAMDPTRPERLELPYTRVAMAALALVEPDARILFVGLGGGAMPRYVRWLLPRARIHAVELDPRVVAVAREWFGFRPDSLTAVHVGDGRAFVEAAAPGSFDLVVLDAFDGGVVPRALATEEFLRAVRASLAPGGVVAGNLHTTDPGYRAMVATYKAVFPGVALLGVPWRRQVVVLAGSAAALARDSLLARVRALQARTDPGFDLAGLVAREYEPAPPWEAPVLRDPR